MRKVCYIDPPQDGICRCMIYGESDGGFYLFLYNKPEDGPCQFDHWYETLTAAEESAIDIGASGNWVSIPDPLEGAQRDWIAPTRVKVGSDGKKLYGQFESIPAV